MNRRHSWYKADLIVTCTPGNAKDPFIAEPVLVVEVLSPTTSATDFSRKLPDYQQIPSMRDILLVSSMERLVRHWRREPDGWVEHAASRLGHAFAWAGCRSPSRWPTCTMASCPAEALDQRRRRWRRPKRR